MKYEYRYRNTAGDIWQLSMYYIYGSMVGLCNLIFTLAVLALAVSKWSSSSLIFKICVVFCFLLFPLVQPVLVYLKAVRQAALVKEDTSICFDDFGVHVSQGGECVEIGWEKMKRVARKPTAVLVFSDSTHGFVLTDRILKGEKKEFFAFAAGKVGGK